MTFEEAYTSLLSLYKKLMFPETPYKNGWTMTEVDQLDFNFFEQLIENKDEPIPEKEVYLSDIW